MFMCPSKHFRLRLSLQLRHVESRDVEALAVITTTVTRSIIVDDAGERDQPRPRDIIDAMGEDEQKRNPEYSKPKKEVDEKRVICKSIKSGQREAPFYSPDDLGRVNPAATIKTENQKM